MNTDDKPLRRRYILAAVATISAVFISGFGVAFVVLGHAADRGLPSDSSSLIPQVATTAALRANFLKEEVNQAPPTPLKFPDQEGAKAFNAAMRKDISGIPKCTNSEKAQTFRDDYAPFCKKYDTTVNGEHPDGKPVCWEQKTQNANQIQKTCMNLQDATQGTPSSPNCMGPLASLIGTWIGEYGKVYSALPQFSPTGSDPKAAGNHFTPIPGQPTADKTSVKNQQYTEKLVFAPILGGVKNRGYENGDPIQPSCQANQILQGVSYKLFIYQTSTSDENGAYGNLLHEEVGQLMYNSFPASGNGETKDWTVARMSVVPHGVTFVATGNNTWYEGPQDGKSGTEALLKEQNDFDLNVRVAPQDCIPGDGYDTQGGSPGAASMFGKKEGDFGYGEEFKGREGQYTDMNPLLTTLTEKVDVKNFVTLSVQQKGDLSQTPFINTQARNSDFISKMWIQNVVDKASGKASQRIQYAQRVTWRFMQHFRCIKCQGGVWQEPVMGQDNTPFNTRNKCYTTCENMDQVWGKLNGLGEHALDEPLASQRPLQTTPFSQPLFDEKSPDAEDWTLNQIPASQNRRCYNCVPQGDVQPANAFDMDSSYQFGNDTRIPIDYERMTLQAQAHGKTCEEEPLARWPHIQVNTLTKVSDDYADAGPLKQFTDNLGDLNFFSHQDGSQGQKEQEKEHLSELKSPP